MSQSIRLKSCSICTAIPEKSDAFWKGGDFLGGDLPREEQQLVVVGAPFFDDRTSYSHTCLKQCPECGTYYEWRFEYEFLVNGTEDDIYLTRMPDKEGEKRAKAIFATIAEAYEKFKADAQPRLETLHTAVHLKGVYGAATFIQSGAMRGHDITFALPALVRALAYFAGKEGADQTEGLLYLVLVDEARKSVAGATAVLQLLTQHNADTTIPRVRYIKEACEKTISTAQSPE